MRRVGIHGRVHLIVDEGYRPADRARRAEIEECRRRNAEVMTLHPAWKEGYRPTFEEMFALASAWSKPGELWAIANADVHFDDTIRKLRGKSLGLAVLALTRREEGLLKTNPWHSQDAWVFEPHEALREMRKMSAQFTQGRWACDNRLAFELAAIGCHVFNPSHEIHVHHLHAKREPNTAPWVPGPYVFVAPVTLSVALAMGRPQGPREAA